NDAVAECALGGIDAENDSLDRIGNAAMQPNTGSLQLWQQADEAALIGNVDRDFRQELFEGLGRIVRYRRDKAAAKVENRKRFKHVADFGLLESEHQHG